jgi:hypothetical protein
MDNLYYAPENEASADKIRANSVLESEVCRFSALFGKKYPGAYLEIGGVRMSSDINDGARVNVVIYYYPNPEWLVLLANIDSLATYEFLHNFAISEGDVTRRVFADVVNSLGQEGVSAYLINDVFEVDENLLGREETLKTTEQYLELVKKSDKWEY